MEAHWLARAFSIVDALCCAAGVATIVLLGQDWATAAVGAVTLLISLQLLRGYAFPRRQGLGRHMRRVGVALFAAATAASVAAVVRGQPLHVVAPPLLIGAAAIVGLHLGWWKIIARARRQGLLTPNIVVVGATANAQRLIEAAMRTGEVNVLGLFDDRLQRAPENILGVPLLGDTGDLLNHRIMPYVDRVVVAITPSAEVRLVQIIEKLGVLPNILNLFVDGDGPDENDANLARIAAGAEHPLSGAADVCKRRALLKRAQDLTFALAGLLTAGPIMLAVAMAIKLDSPGPIFFRQRRHGFNNEEFQVWKFRSMRHELADPRAARQIRAGDDRVTRVGRFIRKTSLDELPQLLNVLCGEMSIVGPRPHAIGMKTGDVESAKLVAEYAHRHRMKPGLTGWAAIKGSRGPVDTPACVRRRVALDIEYIERQSFWLDLYIVLMTIPCLLGDRSAVR